MSNEAARSESAIMCLRCGHPMQEGWVPVLAPFARNIASGISWQTTIPIRPGWTRGKPKWSFWSGWRVSRKDCIPVTTYRCASCGYLEAYAKAVP